MLPTTDLSDDDVLEMDDDVATHLPTVRAAREIRRRRAAERTVPPAIRAGIDRYAMHGIAPGSCLRAIIENDLFVAFQRADPETAAAMGAIVRHIREHVPGATWGSPEAVSRYLASMQRGSSR